MSKWIYRPHVGQLDDAMKQVQYFDTEREMLDWVWHNWNDRLTEPYFDRNDLVLIPLGGNDERIGWNDVQYVCSKRFGEHKNDYPQCIGYASKDYQECSKEA